jgi:hypothetical protein
MLYLLNTPVTGECRDDPSNAEIKRASMGCMGDLIYPLKYILGDATCLKDYY